LRRSTRALLLCVGSWFLLPLAAAYAAPPGDVYLEWERPLGSTCPPAAVLQSDVEEILDRAVFTSERTARMRIRGFIEESATGTQVQLVARDQSGRQLGTRELRASGGGCAALRSDIALVLTLLVERDQLLDESSTAAAVRFGPVLSLMLNVLPGASFGVGGVLALDVEDVLQLQAGLSYAIPVGVRTSSGIEASLHAVSAALRVCPRLNGTSSVWMLSVCGGLQGGAWLVSQTGPSARATQVRLLALGLLELRAGVRLGESVVLDLSAGPSFSISRTSLMAAYAAGSRELLYRLPFLGAQVQLGLSF
jgi:hypothetical protein